jgi:hypothetical protein
MNREHRDGIGKVGSVTLEKGFFDLSKCSDRKRPDSLLRNCGVLASELAYRLRSSLVFGRGPVRFSAGKLVIIAEVFFGLFFFFNFLGWGETESTCTSPG